MRHPRPSQRQRDLFATDDDPPTASAVPDRPMLMALVSMLLTETVMDPRAKEGNREDHL